MEEQKNKTEENDRKRKIQALREAKEEEEHLREALDNAKKRRKLIENGDI